MMRIRSEPMHVMPVIEPDKSYAFTWPGQPRRTVPGHELLAILKGANPTMLDIEESAETPEKNVSEETVEDTSESSGDDNV